MYYEILLNFVFKKIFYNKYKYLLWFSGQFWIAFCPGSENFVGNMIFYSKLECHTAVTTILLFKNDFIP